MANKLPESVRGEDFGIRGFLAYALLNNYEAVILVDAIHGEGHPGTLYTIEPDLRNHMGLSPAVAQAADEAAALVQDLLSRISRKVPADSGARESLGR